MMNSNDEGQSSLCTGASTPLIHCIKFAIVLNTYDCDFVGVAVKWARMRSHSGHCIRADIQCITGRQMRFMSAFERRHCNNRLLDYCESPPLFGLRTKTRCSPCSTHSTSIRLPFLFCMALTTFHVEAVASELIRAKSDRVTIRSLALH